MAPVYCIYIYICIYECCIQNTSEKMIFSTALFDFRAEEERQRHRERTQRKNTGHTDLKGFSPYITVRSTLQSPLERECVVNTSINGQYVVF